MSADHYDFIRQTIETQFKNNWGARTPVAYGNAPFKQPASGTWVNLSVVFGRSAQISMGPPKIERMRCLVACQFFAPKNSGEALVLQHIAFLRGFFQGKQFLSNDGSVNIVLETMQIITTGSRPDLYQQNVNIPFDADMTF